MNEKWEKAKPINPNRCVIDGVPHEWNEAAKQWFPLVDVSLLKLKHSFSAYTVLKYMILSFPFICLVSIF